jgi:hypothetical protein
MNAHKPKNKFSIRKVWPPKLDIGDDGSILHRYSANWAIVEYPGLFLSRAKHRGETKASWSFSCLIIHLPQSRRPAGGEGAIKLFPMLEAQRFDTRIQAVQALEVADNLLDADVL